MKTIKVNPEFAHELACVIPHAYWLHTQGKLDKVITSKDMKPFYYFCDNVEEYFSNRTISTLEGGMTEEMIPMNWIHGKTDEQGKFHNGVLDYSKGWTPPPYKKHYSNKEFNLGKFIVVNNIFNIESGNTVNLTRRFIDIPTLNEIFTYLVNEGYTVIYKRPDNSEFVIDQNEQSSVDQRVNLTAFTDKGLISDYELCDHYDGKVINMNDLRNEYPQYSYNEFQLRLFSNAEGFVSVNGGGSVLCSYFGVPIIVYVPKGKELRPNYLDSPESYFRKLSNSDVYPILDPEAKFPGTNNYSKLINKVKEIF